MKTLNLRDVIPPTIVATKKQNEYLLEVDERKDHYYVHYQTDIYNRTGLVGKRTYEQLVPKEIILNAPTMEILGILQGEMSKTDRGVSTIANSETSIMKKVIDWFENHKLAHRNEWNWYLRFNIPEPDPLVAADLRQAIVPFWISACELEPSKQYKKVLTWTPHTKNHLMANKGTLMIEKGNRIFALVVQRLVATITNSMPKSNKEQIVPFLKGILAAESCINYKLSTGHRRVFVTACYDTERAIFRKGFHAIGITTKDCKPIKDIVISGRDNLLRMHELRLMTLHPNKYEKFLEMVNSYTGWWHEKRSQRRDGN